MKIATAKLSVNNRKGLLKANLPGYLFNCNILFHVDAILFIQKGYKVNSDIW